MNASLTNGSRGTTAWPVTAEDTGMVTATSWVPESYEHYTFPYTQWVAEIRFPIRQTPGYVMCQQVPTPASPAHASISGEGGCACTSYILISSDLVLTCCCGDCF